MAANGGRAAADKSAAEQFEEVELLDDVPPSLEQDGKQHSRSPANFFKSFFMGKRGFQPLRDTDVHEDDSLQAGHRARNAPEEECNIISKILFLYVNPLMKQGAAKHLDEEDLWDMATWNEAENVYGQYKKQLDATSSSKYPHGSVWTALVRAFGTQWALAGIIKLVHDVINLTSPKILQQLLLHLQDDGHQWGSVGWSFLLFLFGCLVPLMINQYFLRVFNTGLYVKTALIQALYCKSLRISLSAKAALGQGTVANLQSNDATKLWNLPQYGHVLWSGPFQVLYIIYSLHTIVGWQAALAGLATTILLVPLNTITGKVVARLRKELVKRTDTRVRIVSEIINGMKAIKLYAWEKPYMERLSEARHEERKAIRKTQLVSCINTITFTAGPILVAIAAFGTYVAMGHEITAAVAFPALAYFDLLRFPIIMLPMQVMNFINARVALRRLQSFMNADEVVEALMRPPAADPSEMAIAISGTFGWDLAKAPTLHNVQLKVPHGSLVIVVGEVGCGKSSLLAALLSEMPKHSGSATVRGSIAYTAQDPWIQNATVEGNVLMGMPMDEDLYERCIDACALTADLDMLPAGDHTEIGEKGVNLSGGQKHRIALARACYADADVYFLDDPLSAVDAHVGRHIMTECITGLLARKTRLLLTHQLQFLPEADLVVTMKEGRIEHIGTYSDLISQGVSFAAFKLDDHTEDSSKENVAEGSQDENGVPAVKAGRNGSLNGERAPAGNTNGGALLSTAGSTSRTLHASLAVPAIAVGDTPRKRKKQSGGQLIGKEERSKGSVDKAVYTTYLRAWGPGLLLPAFFIGMAFMERGLQTGQNYWLTIWSSATLKYQEQVAPEGDAEGGKGRFPTMYYMTVYFSLGLTSMIFQLSRAITLVLATLNASQVLHDTLLRKVMSLPMSFFDTQPSGRLVNRFTRDVERCDIQMQQVISSFATCIVSVTLSVLVVAAVTRGAVFVAIVPLFFLYRSVQGYYLATSRELKRLDSVALSPIFSNFNETLNGLMTVRAFARQTLFRTKNERLMNASNRAWWPIQVINRWLSLRLEFMGQTIVLAAALFASAWIQDAGLAGLALTSALSIVSLMNWATRQSTELELGMNSVERLIEYESYESERPAIIDDSRPPPAWPATGAIAVKDLIVKYRPELPPVLKGLTFTIAAHEKVGICGRTGCGKSTLMLALYRIVEPMAGSIQIDGIEATSIGLYDLRSKLSLVPQDPVIFSGSLRSNLDPFGNASDFDMWQALKQAGLEAAVQRLEGGLDTNLEEGGTNLSVGQRQLLCMSRALLKRSTILLMDEATSNVDNDTDTLIQRTIRTAFRDCTVLTIAHRLHTIIDSDKILMLDAGEVAEFDAPQTLLSKPQSAFRRLVQDSAKAKNAGVVSSKSSMALAQELLQDEDA